MATVDSRIGDEGFRPEVYLKIWWWDRKSDFWILNSRINRPHGLNEITSISFSPTVVREKMLLVTTGEDKQVKTWRLRTNVDRNGEVEGTTFSRLYTSLSLTWVARLLGSAIFIPLSLRVA
jgi:NET1-associated nuclear protein 1 (U3 small nucleolar RNA-associated protein 17)